MSDPLGDVFARARERDRYARSVQNEYELVLMPETEPASEIALAIAEEMRQRGLRDLPADVLQQLILVVLDENDYRICRRHPPEMPPDSELEPVTQRGRLSVIGFDERRKDHAEAERLAEMQGEQPGWVYYLHVGDKIKIGFTSQPTRRLKAYPPESQLLAIHPGTKELEGELHKRFDHSLVAGREWFTPNLALDEHLKDVLAQFGPPSDLFKPRYRKRNDTITRPRNWSGK